MTTKRSSASPPPPPPLCDSSDEEYLPEGEEDDLPELPLTLTTPVLSCALPDYDRDKLMKKKEEEECLSAKWVLLPDTTNGAELEEGRQYANNTQEFNYNMRDQ